MATFKQTVMITDGGQSRAVRVTIEAPSIEGLDIQALAQEAWIRPGKKMKAANVTVIVKKLGR
jgi:hypothetical protein